MQHLFPSNNFCRVGPVRAQPCFTYLGKLGAISQLKWSKFTSFSPTIPSRRRAANLTDVAMAAYASLRQNKVFEQAFNWQLQEHCFYGL